MQTSLPYILYRSLGVVCLWLIAILQLTATPVDTLGTAVVVRQHRPKSIRSATPVQHFDTADIRLRGLTDIGDALRRFAGVNLRDYGGAGGLKTISIRGLGALHTQVVYDGLNLSNPRQGQIDLQRFNLDNLARIELQTLDNPQLLAPVGQLGGATLSLTSLQNPTTDRRLHGQAALRQASFNAWNPSLSLHYTTPNRTTAGFSCNYFFADNNYPFYVSNGKASEWLHRTNSRMQTASVQGYAKRNWTNGYWQFQINGNHNDRHLPGPVILYVNENHEQLKEQDFGAQFRYQQHKGRTEWFTAGKVHWEDSRYTDRGGQYPDGKLYEHYIQREAYITAGLSYTLFPGLQLAYATDGKLNGLQSNLKDENHVSRATWLHALSLQWKNNWLEITARGIGHLYYHAHSGHQSARNVQRLTPSVTASCRLLSKPFLLYLRTGYKESFRLPTFTESYFRHYGSTNLRPELARQLNAGLTLQTVGNPHSPTWALTCDVYHNRIKDHIVSVPYNLFVWRTLNLGDVRTTGVDLTLNSNWSFTDGHRLLLGTSYTFQRARDCMPANPQTYGNQLAYTPLHSGSGSLTWDNPWISFVAHTTFSGERWATPEHMETTLLPAYHEWGFALFRSFHIGRVNFLLRTDLINAFNRRYEVIRRYPMPGRAYKLSLHVDF